MEQERSEAEAGTKAATAQLAALVASLKEQVHGAEAERHAAAAAAQEHQERRWHQLREAAAASAVAAAEAAAASQVEALAAAVAEKVTASHAGGCQLQPQPQDDEEG